MEQLNNIFWQKRYEENQIGWDLGTISPPLKTYFDQLRDKNLKILIPGAGNAYEAKYLFKNGFKNVFVLDWAKAPLENLKNDVPSFPDENLIQEDFFNVKGNYDLIIEQTFFCALNPNLREKYVEKMHQLLKPNSKLVGLLFDATLNDTHPPFGGCKEEYLTLFSKKFNIKVIEIAHNSVKPRIGNELFIIFEKK